MYFQMFCKTYLSVKNIEATMMKEYHNDSKFIFIIDIFIMVAFSHVSDFNTRNKLLTQKLLKQGIISFAKPILNSIDDAMIRYLNSKLDLNLSCAKDFQNMSSMVTW